MFYGFRYFSGRNTTWANMGQIAGELKAFRTKKDLDHWLSNEKISAPCDLNGGERVRITRKDSIRLFGQKAFVNARLELEIETRYQKAISEKQGY